MANYGSVAQGPPPMAEPSYRGEVPHEDVDENSARREAPSAPSAPPPTQIGHIGGYETVQYNENSFAPPPSYQDSIFAKARQENVAVQPNIPAITEEQARECLLEYVGQQCCYGKAAARDFVFARINPSSAFHYTLETFTEKRQTKWKFVPYFGGPLDGPHNGPAPMPWDIQVQKPPVFQNENRHIPVPHTESVKPCHKCGGCGHCRCHTCCGRGRLRCASCGGRGWRQVMHQEHHDHHDHHHHHHHGHGHGHHHHHHHHAGSEPCPFCHGSGRKICFTCSGHGQVKCNICQSAGQLKFYIELTINWVNHKLDHVVERTALPDELIRGASGRLALEDTQPRLYPVVGFPEQEINDSSQRLLDTHLRKFTNNELILMQRHKVRIVPVSEAVAVWKNQEFTYFVYGDNRLVYTDSYPQTCCWGCTVL